MQLLGHVTALRIICVYGYHNVFAFFYGRYLAFCKHGIIKKVEKGTFFIFSKYINDLICIRIPTFLNYGKRVDAKVSCFAYPSFYKLYIYIVFCIYIVSAAIVIISIVSITIFYMIIFQSEYQ